MAEGDIKNLIIMALIMSMAATGMFMFIGGAVVAYPSHFINYSNSTNYTVFDKIGIIGNNTHGLWNASISATAKTIGDEPSPIVTGVTDSISLVYNSVDVLTSLIGSLGSFAAVSMGLDVAWIVTGVTAIIAVIVIVSVFAVVMKREF